MRRSGSTPHRRRHGIGGTRPRHDPPQPPGQPLGQPPGVPGVVRVVLTATGRPLHGHGGGGRLRYVTGRARALDDLVRRAEAVEDARVRRPGCPPAPWRADGRSRPAAPTPAASGRRTATAAAEPGPRPGSDTRRRPGRSRSPRSPSGVTRYCPDGIARPGAPAGAADTVDRLPPTGPPEHGRREFQEATLSGAAPPLPLAGRAPRSGTPTEAAPPAGPRVRSPRRCAPGTTRSLAALLRARPDLLTPVPTDLTQLATRAGTRASVVRALERLDRFALQTAEALAVAPGPGAVRRCWRRC